jgi:hypothetical protein
MNIDQNSCNGNAEKCKNDLNKMETFLSLDLPSHSNILAFLIHIIALRRLIMIKWLTTIGRISLKLPS